MRALNASESSQALACLQEDASAFLYTTSVAIADALRGLEAGFYTWATVKLYYAVFYTARCALALEETAMVYSKGKPFTLKLTPGSLPVKQKGTTHEGVLSALAASWKANSGATPSLSMFLSQQIASLPPFDWLKDRREEANYRNPQCVEPLAPPHFSRVASIGIRKATIGYLSPGGDTYLFDPDHAMLCFPLMFWRTALIESRSRNWPDVVKEESDFLKSVFRDGAGPLPQIHSLL